jgi:Flp pilus assembly protein TadG
MHPRLSKRYTVSTRFSRYDCLYRWRNETGAALLEYAFIFIMFLTLMLGIGGFAHAFFTYHQLNHAAKEATRYAAVRGSECSLDSSCVAANSASGITGPTTLDDVQTFVQNITPQSIDRTKLVTSACGVSGQAACTSSGPQVCTAATGSLPATSDYPGCTVSVTVSYPYTFIFPLLPSTKTTTAPCTFSGICMSSTSEMIIVH